MCHPPTHTCPTQIKHLLSVETDEEHYERLRIQAAFDAVRRPLHFRHQQQEVVRPHAIPPRPVPSPPWSGKLEDGE